MRRAKRVAGAVVGSAVGDALGAPFVFGPPGAYSARFPDGVGQMCGGGGGEPGEATDDTRMAVLVADSLLARGGFDPSDVFARIQRWAAAEPKDMGLRTEAVLTPGEPWDLAAARHFGRNQRAAGNGALTRSITAAVFFATAGREATMEAARGLAALTHGDPAAWEASAVFHELLRVALDGEDPAAAVAATLPYVDPEHRERWSRVLAPDWHPDHATEFNGAVWPCLGSAVWALRRTRSYQDAVRAAIDLGGDTDTVGCVTGGLAGAVYGIDAIPDRWTQALWVPVPGCPGRSWRTAQLAALARQLDGDGSRAEADPVTRRS